ncbi:hypothetical protein MC885_007937, partial [Smutsia gigantea]
ERVSYWTSPRTEGWDWQCRCTGASARERAWPALGPAPGVLGWGWRAVVYPWDPCVGAAAGGCKDCEGRRRPGRGVGSVRGARAEGFREP